jgi:PleD family two-component response regulator
LSNTDCQGVKVTIDRLRKIGIGTLPDGHPITAAIGSAERILDAVTDWQALLDLAEQRLQEAKHQGKDRSVYCGERAYTGKISDH